ncbi:unnamed protein product [Toxocara canis]|uniref:UBC core domain-containing protein n=1 Tax=Toxocara canis TaxID=6265 RepID=A0A183UQN5_TOXCA|nr:unnamed protein product [Toxocara canis]
MRMHLQLPERLSPRSASRNEHPVQPARSRMDLQDGIYAIVSSLPSKYPSIPTAFSFSMFTPMNSSVAKFLQHRYPHIFSSDLGHYNLVKNTWMERQTNQR